MAKEDEVYDEYGNEDVLHLEHMTQGAVECGDNRQKSIAVVEIFSFDPAAQ